MLHRLGTWLLGALLLAQGFGKGVRPAEYVAALERFRLFGGARLQVLAAAWIVTELVAGGGLLAAGLFSTIPRTAAMGAAALAVVDALGYIALTFSAKLRGIWVPNCTCFGTFLPQPLSISVLLQDVWMLGWTSWTLFHFARTT